MMQGLVILYPSATMNGAATERTPRDGSVIKIERGSTSPAVPRRGSEVGVHQKRGRFSRFGPNQINESLFLPAFFPPLRYQNTITL